MNMNRQVLNSMEHGLHGQELRLSPLPFTLSQHSPSLNQLQSGGNITLGSGNNMGSATYGLPNNVYSDGITLFSQFGQIFPQLNNPAQQLPNDKLDRCTSPNHRDGSRGGPVPTLSNDGNSGKSSSAYASRHQAAEQRRRTRINERLDLLRKMVPHTDRANTASFLEEVLKYIDVLKTRVAELEATLVAIKTGKTAMLPPNDVRLNLSSSNGSIKGDMHGLSHEHAGLLPQSNQQQLNTGYSLQQLQQQQLQQQQLLQQQQIQHHEAALAALREEQQQQAAAILAAQQLKQQQELAAARQSCQMADLAAQLGLKTVQGLGQGSQSGMKSDSNLSSNPNMDALSMLAKQASKDAGHRMGMHGHGSVAPSPLGQQSGGLYLPPVQQLQVAGVDHQSNHSNHSNHPNHSNHSNSVLALLPSGSTASGAATAGQPSSQKARAAAAAAAATSPASSEDSGMPLKKRKVLML